MKQFIKWPYRVLRTCLIMVVALLFLIPSALYVALSLPGVQRDIADRAETELSKLLSVTVKIDRLTIVPFNRLTLQGVTIADSNGHPAIEVNRLSAGISLLDYLRRKRIILTYIELSGLDAHLTKATPHSPLNIQPIINALKPKDRTKPPTRFDLQLNTVVVRNSSISYDVLSAPFDSLRFDPNHIKASDIRADIVAPRIKNDDFTVDLRRLSLRERSGVKVSNLTGTFHITDKSAEVGNLIIDFAASHICFGDIRLTYNGFNDLKSLWTERPVSIDILRGSYIGCSDAAPFEPRLRGLDLSLNTTLHAEASRNSIHISTLELNSSYGFDLNLSGNVTDPLSPDRTIIDVPRLSLSANAPKLLDLAGRFTTLPSNARTVIANLGTAKLDGSLTGTLKEGKLLANLNAAPGNIDIESTYHLGAMPSFGGHASFDSFNGSALMKGIEGPLADLGNLTADITYDITLPDKRHPNGKVRASIADIMYRQHHFTDITMRAEAEGSTYSGSIAVDNPGVFLDLDLAATLDGPAKHLDINLAARDVEPALFNIDSAHPDRRFSIYCICDLSGPDIDHLSGQIDIDDLSYGTADNAIYLQDLDFQLSNDDGFSQIRMSSDIADGLVEGNYRITALPPLFRNMVASLVPALTGAPSPSARAKLDEATDNLYYSITLKDTSPIEPLVKLPVKVINPIKIDGALDARDNTMEFRLDAPYLQQGNKLFENSTVVARLNGPASDSIPARGDIEVSTLLDTKKGPMSLLVTANASNNHIDTKVGWNVVREREFSGNLSVSAVFDRDEQRQLVTNLYVNPGQMVFNDTVWTVEPSTINIEGKRAAIHNFRIGRDRQFLTIEGDASADPADSIIMTLEDVNLDYVFETLNIPTAMFGGNATGKFYATELFTSRPKAYTPGLHVRNLTYNHSLMGNAFIKSAWLPDSKAITLDADIHQPNGRHSFINGSIKPLADSLDLSFNADKISIGFLYPFMSAFASGISGEASGKARLYGSFKLIDMVGDVYGEDVKLTLGFTNTTYSTTDSVHFRPGRIDIPGITIKDMYGNTAKVNGWVTHECFKQPKFEFQVRDASNLLVYDIKESPDTKWFGHVFGSGTASVKGVPGLVEIGATITTDPNSSFTFILSDALNAQDYKFITFRDRDQARKDSIAAATAPPEFVRELKKRLVSSSTDGPPSIYRINITVNVTPQAQVTLVMDPVGGDRIRAYGKDTMIMGYDSANEDLKLNGTFTVERGKYNFTLQDIIIKEFNIKSGSSIAFNGNPYAPQLNIAATYTVNANLSDLDKSFLADKDLNRTNVPVNALLLVTGDMRRPDINFDLEFPTLTEDVYRKVRSIVNTADMMNRQIIYLVALSRFYTPEYMSATKGNELVSVASSTLSSQLSSMLGQISDKWSLAPNIRSDRGDFSDVEVDLALSSHLLNNRLMLNGNFGYRDKDLNNNSFIGDFDIEYLLNRRGTIRLKAYNRYNDQNYYVKSALTTQGVGLIFKRDFDNMFSFLKPWLRHHDKKADSTAVTTDSISRIDSIKHN